VVALPGHGLPAVSGTVLDPAALAARLIDQFDTLEVARAASALARPPRAVTP
jgi:hypothetical protein